MFSRITMSGLGDIGLPTATLLAASDQQVIGVDRSQHAVDTINPGRIHIVEPELDVLVHAAGGRRARTARAQRARVNACTQ